MVREGDKPHSSWFDSNPDGLLYRLLKRAEIRRSIRSEQDRIANLLEEAATEIIRLRGISGC